MRIREIEGAIARLLLELEEVKFDGRDVQKALENLDLTGLDHPLGYIDLDNGAIPREADASPQPDAALQQLPKGKLSG